MGNNINGADPRLPPAIRSQWTGQAVFNFRKTNEKIIADRQRAIMAEHGTKQLAALVKARSQLYKALTEEERAEYEAIAKRWSDKGPPVEDLIRYVVAE